MNLKAFSFLLIIIVFACSTPTENSSASDWQSLFNGENFEGWEKRNGTASYKIEDGAIIGTTQHDTPNTFLCTKKHYSNFIFEFEVMIDSMMNSGVQFRSNSRSNYKDGRVFGYQCEIDPNPRAWSGGIYDEARRGWIYPLEENKNGRKAFKNGQWNQYRIEALGDNIRIWVNGINTANLRDTVTATGFIGLQVHSIGKEEEAGKMVKWRNLRIITDTLKAYAWNDRLTAPLIDLRK